MRLKSFYGPTLTDAMRLVRETLGDEAIIVATREDESGDGIRVTAAIEEAPPSPLAFPEKRLPDSDAPSTPDAIETIAGMLVRHRIENRLAEKLLATATQYANDDPVVSLGTALDVHFKFSPLTTDALSGPVLFVGPPGAGKTLITARLATCAVLAKRPVAVISADIERAGGFEQLAAFTRLLKIDLLRVEDAAALKDAREMQEQDALVLIDTPGRNLLNNPEREWLRPMIKVCGGAILLLPADMDSAEAIDTASDFKLLGATRLIFSRLDMTRRLGSLLRTSYETRLPLAGYTSTTKVTEAPVPLNPISLARLILEGVPSRQPAEDIETEALEAS